tara:strand:- start:70 stop:1320 length:1251 start_codon:yes stop_codon:yes gene_type:complete
MAVEKAISYDQARKKINKAAPKGHQLAFITPAEAKMLKDKGGSGEMTEAGIKSYRGHTGAHGKGGGSSSGSSGSSGSGQGGDKKGRKSSKVAQRKSKSFSQKLAEKRAKNEAQRAQVKANQAAARAQNEFNRATGFMTKKGFLRDKFGNIVRSKTQVDRFNKKKEAEQRAAQSTIANPNLRPGTRTVSPAQFRARAEQELAMQRAQRDALMDAARARNISSQQLAALARSNQRLGLNPTTGMGIGQSLRFQGQGIMRDLPGLAKAAGFIANPLGSIATGLLTGGKGIASLAGDILAGLKTKGQNVLSEFRGEDIVGYTADGTPVRVGQSITETTDRPGFLSGIASALRLGEGPGFTEERGGGGGREPLLPIIPPVQPTPAAKPFDPKRIKKAVTPVGTAVTEDAINEYLRLAGFNV